MMAKKKIKLAKKPQPPAPRPTHTPVAFYKVKWTGYNDGKVGVVSLAEPTRWFDKPLSPEDVVRRVFGRCMYGEPSTPHVWSGPVSFDDDPGKGGLWKGRFLGHPFYVQDMSFLYKSAPKRKAKATKKGAKKTKKATPKLKRRLTSTHAMR